MNATLVSTRGDRPPAGATAVPVTNGSDGGQADQVAPLVDVVVPVHDEVRVLEASVRRLHHHLVTTFPFTWRITIADNASGDGTGELADRLAHELTGVRSVRLDRKGRGLALKAAWSSSDATVLAYTDVDLSTDLDALLPLVAPLVSGHSDLAIGSRLAPGAVVARGPRREAISRAYNLLLHTVFAVGFRDAQCGFKAVRADAATALLPQVEDDGWFFDTELLLLAEHAGLRIHELAVDWVDDPDSRVDVVATALGDLRGMARMARRFLAGRVDDSGLAPRTDRIADDMGRQLVVFALIGTISTVLSLGLFLALHPLLGPVGANALAISATALANTWANRRYTFRRGTGHRRRADYLRGALVYLAGLGISTLALLGARAAGAELAGEVVVLLGAWSSVAVARFVLLRGAHRPEPGALL